MGNNYRILPVRDFSGFIEENRLVKRDSLTQAKLYEGTNGNYYLIPAVGYKGIESEKKEILDSILLSGHIPIEEDSLNIFMENKKSIEAFPESIQSVILHFNEKYKLSIAPEDMSFDYKQLDSLINKTKKEDRYAEFAFFVGIIMGEKLRMEKHAAWKLEKRYGYNPYFEPKVFVPENKTTYNPWYWIVRTLSSGRKFDFLSEYARIFKS